jgi:putative nucleotidyltransferase with HDIG domain
MFKSHKNGAIARIIILASSVALISAAHFTIGTLRHSAHIEHIVLQDLYVVPIVVAALWFGISGTLITLVVVSAVYYSYMRLIWPDRPMENANQAAMLAIYWVVGSVTAALVHIQEKQRKAHALAQSLARREAMMQALQTLSDALRLRDEYTRQHSERVAQLGIEIGKRLGLSAERLDALRLAGLMHDIGKIGIRDDVLFKSAQLSPGERARIEQHPVMAAEILRLIDGAQDVADIVVAHHESPDGSGYPNHLTSSDIPLEAHILRVADVFCSLRDERPYKSGFDVRPALDIMRMMTPSKLDQRSMAVLEALVAEDNSAARNIGLRAD